MHTYERTHERTHAFARAGPCACAREHTHMRGGARRATLSAYKGSMHLCRRTDKRVRLLCVYVLGGGGGGACGQKVCVSCAFVHVLPAVLAHLPRNEGNRPQVGTDITHALLLKPLRKSAVLLLLR